MKLGLKIILPMLLLFIIILGAFGYLLYSLKQQEAVIFQEGSKIQKLNSLNERLARQQEQTDYYVLIYRFNHDRSSLLAISQAELDKSKTLDEMYPFITSTSGRELVASYIDSRKEVELLRGELISAIDGGNKEQIVQSFNKWSIKTENIKAALSDIKAYNINSLEKTLVLVNSIGNQIVQVTIILGFVVVVTVLFLLFYLRAVITIPIIKLAQLVDEISRQNFTTTTTTTTRKDELGMLSRAFNTMVVKLRESYMTLEQRVADRTDKLAEKTLEAERSQKATLNVLEDLNTERTKLQTAKAKDEALLESIGEGVVATDKEGQVILVNKVAENLLGFTSAEMLGKFFIHIISMQDEEGNLIPDKLRPITLALSSGKSTTTTTTTTTTTYYFVRRDGIKFPVAVVVTPIIIDSKTAGAVIVFRDITKEKEIDRAKTDFVSLASHQLRTPLTSINWYIEMLQEDDAGVLNDKQREFLFEIYKGSKRMVQLVNDLLNISRLETGRLKIEPVPIDLIALIQEIRKEVEPQVVDAGCHVTLDFSEKKVSVVNIDKILFRQVIVNLLTNAIRYSSDGKNGQVHLSLTVSPQAYTISIRDNGIGLPKEAQTRLFEKFYRADNARAVVADGNGLGLYLAKQIMDASGGAIGFDSSGKGTTFYVTIPLSGMISKQGEKGLEG